MKKLVLLLGIVSLSLTRGATRYVRSGASGNGTDWSNAYGSLPTTLVRGDTYYIADGIYGSYTFDDALSGTKYITVKKATHADHGTDTGWDHGYGDGQAVFSALGFKSGYYIFDGVTGGGPGSWTAGHGFKVTNSNYVTSYFLFFYAGGSHIELYHSDIGNTSYPGPGCDVAVYSVKGASHVRFAYNDIHDFGDVGIMVRGGSNWLFEYNRFDRLGRSGPKPEGCGTVGQNNHGSGFPLGNNQDMVIRYNMLSNMEASGWIGNYGNNNIKNLHIYGNIFHNTPDYSGTWGTGIIYTLGSTDGTYEGLKVYNNTFVNINHYTIIGIKNNLGNEFYNNIIYNVNSGTRDPVYYGTAMDYNASDEPVSNDAHAQVLDNGAFVSTDHTSGAFCRLATGTRPGQDLGAPYNMDMFGNIRGADGTWDRGAIEYSTTNIERRTPNAERRIPLRPSQGSTIRLYDLAGKQVIKTQTDVSGIYLVQDKTGIHAITIIK